MSDDKRKKFLVGMVTADRNTYATGTLLNCISLDYRPTTGTLLNCHQPRNPSSGTTLNCNLAQASHDMPSGHVGHLSHLRHLRHWTYCGMPSGPYIILGHLRQLRHPGHLGHLGHLSNVGNLNPLDPAPTDSLPGAFITEMDPMDLGPSEGCYADDSLDPLHTNPLETATQDIVPYGTITQVR